MTALSVSAQETAPTEARGHFYGSKWEYRRILWGAMLALIVTLGLHRFTVTTNIRRYLWSRTDLDGDQLDYTGDAIELLLGFLVLIVVLAPLFVVIAIAVWAVSETVLSVAFVFFWQFAPLFLMVPLATLTLYQARRYRVNHTVFRGLCFRQTGSAFVYFLLIAFWTVIVTITLGLAYPWARASLERYKMRHTHYGDMQGSFQGSGWTLFKRGFLAWLAALTLAVLPGFLIDAKAGSAALSGAYVFYLLILPLAFYPVFRAKVVRWRIAGMRFGDLSFESNFSTWRFTKPYLKFYGWILLLLIVVGILAAVVQTTIIPRLPIGQSIAVEVAGVVGLVIAYFSIATIIAFAFQGTVRFETWRLIVDSLILRGVDQLDRVKAPATGDLRRKGRTGAALNLGGF